MNGCILKVGSVPHNRIEKALSSNFPSADHPSSLSSNNLESFPAVHHLSLNLTEGNSGETGSENKSRLTVGHNMKFTCHRL